MASGLCELLRSATSLRHVKEAHALATTLGLRHHLPLTASLITNYALRADLRSSCLLFSNSHNQTTFLYNTIIRAHTYFGEHFLAFEFYNGMVRAGARPDDHSFPFLLKACADIRSFEKGREVHGAAVKVGFASDVFVGNTMIAFYMSCGCLDAARKVFDEMPQRDIVSWNSILGGYSQNGCFEEALRLFLGFREEGWFPNQATVVTMMPICASLKDLKRGKEIHDLVKDNDVLSSHVTVWNAIVDMYAKCGDLISAYSVFTEMVFRNQVSWNAIISGFSYNGAALEAVDMFRRMLDAGERPNSVTMASLLPSLVQLELFPLGKEVHAYCLRNGSEMDVFVHNSLIDMYAKSGHLSEGCSVFNMMAEKNVVSWNAVIANLVQNGCELEAIEFLRQMQEHGGRPTSVTYTNILPACSRVQLLRHGKEIHARSIREGSIADIFVTNAVMDVYAKCGSLHLAGRIFDSSERDEVSYNTLIVGYAQSWHCVEALTLFSEMGFLGLRHDSVSFIGVLLACANLSAIKQGKEIHGSTVRKHFASQLFVANSLLDVYTKCGRLDFARRIFDKMHQKDVASCNAMILGYGMHGELEVAINLFEGMKDKGIKYDHVSYLAVLSACSHAGLVDQGRKYFEQMQYQNLTPTQMHCACMVDLFGRAGLMKEAVDFINDLEFEPDANVWGALLGASRVHGDVELGIWAAEHLFELKSEHCGYYILLSNMYAEAGRWEEAKRVRQLMKSRGVKKNPGCSWIEVGNRVHAFLVGDTIDARAGGVEDCSF
ncbi:pentatricopeptide repeat-containing protein At3g16610-like [Nymphaea colorata]|uniref:Pentacotripeptide-repeat region of PRORP domain-containing protein n=1 Tax=Nymphaea colorata TaxID=210225 RepID=A0A5K1BII6_9MAGN|nr:pentatricopeptide repeat-containing protein At3g16610-like [Nymphaea colorata]